MDYLSPIIGFDIKNYSNECNIKIKQMKRDILSKSVADLLKELRFNGISYFSIVMEGGDGFMTTVNTSSLSTIIEFMIRFNDFLKINNSFYDKDIQIKVRGIVHYGTWEETDQINIINSWDNNIKTAIGSPIDETARYLNCDELRLFLDENIEKKDFVFGISNIVYDSIKNTSFFLRYKNYFNGYLIKVKQFEGKIYLFSNNLIDIEQAEIDINTNNKITLEIKDFLIKRFSNEKDFDDLCLEIGINNIFSGDFDSRMTSFLSYLVRNYQKPLSILKNKSIKLKPDFQKEIEIIFNK